MPEILNVSWRDIQALPRDGADHRLQYGEDSLQFGELRLPVGSGPFPVVVLIHGGCWLNAFSLDHVSAMGRAFANEGFAVWTPEYRRVGDAGGGWPGTFEDIISCVGFLPGIARKYSLDLGHLVVMGHSAGGHLALWLAAQKTSSLSGAISLAGISDLKAYEILGNDCASSLPGLLGGTSREMPERWKSSNPLELLPMNVPISLIHGEIDAIVPLSQSEVFAKAAGADLQVIKGGGHFDMVSPHSSAFSLICQALKQMTGP